MKKNHFTTKRVRIVGDIDSTMKSHLGSKGDIIIIQELNDSKFVIVKANITMGKENTHWFIARDMIEDYVAANLELI